MLCAEQYQATVLKIFIKSGSYVLKIFTVLDNYVLNVLYSCQAIVLIIFTSEICILNIHNVCCTGVQAFAEALLIIVKVLAQNSGLDPQEAIVKLQQEYIAPDQAVGLDIKTGEFIVYENSIPLYEK